MTAVARQMEWCRPTLFLSLINGSGGVFANSGLVGYPALVHDHTLLILLSINSTSHVFGDS